MTSGRLLVVRCLALLVVAFGGTYMVWRWSSTIAWGAWWIAVPLVLAETYSFGESVLYGVTMWNSRRRPAPPPAPHGRTVDVFIATYNEPLEIVLTSAIAARDMTYPHKTWILDDGNRQEFADAAKRIGVGYIVRGPDWDGRPRFAKAGNVNNALFRTSGEFIAVFDADQVPDPAFLDRVLGYFDDPEVAFVQTPQRFWNVPRSDPLGSGADLFYGPIQQGKDGWGAAFFCGSNAVLRREALMALGLTMFSRSAAERVRKALHDGRRRVQAAVNIHLPGDIGQIIGRRAVGLLVEAEARVRRGDVLADVTYVLRRQIKSIATSDMLPQPVIDAITDTLGAAEVARTDRALAIDPIVTSSITEDMATAMHLHALGWASVYHHEVLVQGLAPEDVRTMLSQRQRWATGTMQVFFSDNPLLLRGLTIGQRLMYLATMTSYLNGFAAVVYIAAPMVFLVSGIFPIKCDSIAFFVYFMPFFLCSQTLFVVAGNRSRGLWRGQQMSFALFPTWIKATVAGASAAFFGKTLTFAVTQKTKQATGIGLRHIRPQLIAMAALVLAGGYGAIQAADGERPLFASIITLIWVGIDIVLLSAMTRAARYRGPGHIDSPFPAALTDEVRDVIAAIHHPTNAASTAAIEPCHAPTPPAANVPVRAAGAELAILLYAAARFDAVAALALRSHVAESVLGGAPIVLVDVSGVRTITPSAVAVVVDLLRLLRTSGGDLRIFGDSRSFALAYETMALSHVTRLHGDPEEAADSAYANGPWRRGPAQRGRGAHRHSTIMSGPR
ncbi:glycosyltransferase family 2 protein [Mycolicibacterium fluoranthenivorans]|uniref:Cellulose synthase (UDP-forming) n=1 Tax=Mycolicibacterium fluoranthenivorans TaxID=258505 RepID=A0A1G4VUF0_9MYCO|nr:glycosyltransferase family 2 protein [Mycolicibacterium fluoranthenivorans]SCX11561.1 cellulose synthase (UDP-forming) [Mycolicibacterium fluoranthenivorans]